VITYTTSERDTAMMIAALEYSYWRDLPPAQNELVLQVQIGAMGAAANICAALALGKSIEEFRLELANRGRPVTDARPTPGSESQRTSTPEPAQTGEPNINDPDSEGGEID
jgi:hypothetical protein